MEKGLSTPVSFKKPLATALFFVKDELLYICGYLFFIALLVLFVPKTVTSYIDTHKKVDVLKHEVAKVRTDTSYIEQYNAYDTKKLITILDTLMPSKEDYFSAISAVNQYANKNGVALLSHTSPFKAKQTSRVQVTMVLSGDMSSLMKLLSNYHYISGRFMTIDGVAFKQLERKITIDVSFYSLLRSSTSTQSLVAGPPDAALLLELQKLPESQFDSQSLSVGKDFVPSYASTSDPFFGVSPTPTLIPVPTTILTPGASESAR